MNPHHPDNGAAGSVHHVGFPNTTYYSSSRKTADSSNESDDANSDSAMTTLPIGERVGSLQRQANMTYFYGSGTRLSGKELQQQHHENNNRIEVVASASSAVLDVVTGKDCSDDACVAMDDMQPMSGRSAFAFWTIVVIMFVLALGNLVLTVSIVGVLRMGRGIEFMELVPESDTIKFYGETYLDRVYKRDGRIEGFADVPVSITGSINCIKPSA